MVDRLIDREVPTETTIAVARSLCQRYGITRVADTTWLDRIGIPTMSAIVPNSPDNLGVYNGKGLTREAALAGALMEAIERQICARFEHVDTYEVPLRQVNDGIDLRALGWLDSIGDAPSTVPLTCARGVNLIGDVPIDVPVGVVRCPRFGERQFHSTTTNGLASGNTWNEAVYHALMELVERHLWSRVHVLAHVWPRTLRARAQQLVERPDDPVANEVVHADRHELLGNSISRILAAGLDFRLLEYHDPGWPYAMMACISDTKANELFYHLGFGCSWSPVHAAIRAITEAVQVRVTDIQGAREDIKRSDEPPVRAFEHGRRAAGLPTGGRWYFDGPAGTVALSSLRDKSGPDLGTDIARLVGLLREWGETCVACVDLTPPGVPIRVVRVVAPHLERTLVDGTISAALRAFIENPFAVAR